MNATAALLPLRSGFAVSLSGRKDGTQIAGSAAFGGETVLAEVAAIGVEAIVVATLDQFAGAAFD